LAAQKRKEIDLWEKQELAKRLNTIGNNDNHLEERLMKQANLNGTDAFDRPDPVGMREKTESNKL
jgi:hypothetical protein